MRVRTFSLCLVTLLVAILGGCAARGTPPADGKVHAGCRVCECNADLACVDVIVDERTPRVEHAGRTYYFCSEDCAKEFRQSPGRFAVK